MDTASVMAALSEMHSSALGWAFIPELRLGTSYGESREQRMDAWAISLWASRGPVPFLRRAFEIKMSKSDCRKELLNSDKRWMAMAYSHEFYFVAPAGIVPSDLLSDDDGLMEFDETGLRISKKPRIRESMFPKWEFVASIARRADLRDSCRKCKDGYASRMQKPHLFVQETTSAVDTGVNNEHCQSDVQTPTA